MQNDRIERETKKNLNQNYRTFINGYVNECEFNEKIFLLFFPVHLSNSFYVFSDVHDDNIPDDTILIIVSHKSQQIDL